MSSAFDQIFRIPSIPEYGNYGGPGHSGERTNPDGSLYYDPDTGNTVPYYKDPVDALDALFKAHDRAYDAAKENGDRTLDYLKADVGLIIAMNAIDTSGLDPYSNTYIWEATRYFTMKIIALSMSNPMDSIRDQFDIAEKTLSPLILDLDGDGVETTGVKSGAYFDHAGDGFAEQTGWVGADDGLLVYDRNGNGRIDTGTELFGSNTLLADGTMAANGFEALKELDTNHDGKIDAQDAAFANLRVWKDADSDGYTSDGELLTLGQVGVQSINTGYRNSTLVDANANAHKQAGGFTRTDGSAAMIEDVWFQTDNMYTIAEEWLEVPDDIAALPDLQGYGQVYDLHQAMARDVSGHLKSLVEQFVAEVDPAARNALTTQIIYAWADVEDKDPNSRATKMIYGNAIGDARKLYAIEAFLGEGYLGTWCWGERDPNPHGPAAAKLLTAFDEFANGITAQLMAQTRLRSIYAAIDYTWDENTQTIKSDLSMTIPLFADKLAADREQGRAEITAFVTNLTYTHNLSALDTQTFQQALEAFGQDVASVVGMALRGMVATQGSDCLTGDGADEIIAGWGGNDIIYGGGGNDQLMGEEGNDSLCGDDGNDTLDGGMGNDLLDGGVGNDTYLFGLGAGQDTIWSTDSTTNKQDTLKLGTGVLPDDVSLSRNADDLILKICGTGDLLTVVGYFVNDGVSPSSLEAIEFENGTVWDFAAVKVMLPSVGTEGDDLIRGYNTEEVIDGLGGNDVIEGQGGDDTLSGGVGDDSLWGGAGNDTLDGGAGNDALQGETGNDTYTFNLGDGQDTIFENDSTAGNLDTIRFGEGIAASDITFVRSGYDLIMGINGTSDLVKILNWGYEFSCRIERVEFADGTIWDAGYLHDQISSVPIVGTGGVDYLRGWLEFNNIFQGLGGNDTLYGDDVGNNTYLFGRGDGHDLITDYDSTSTKLDTIQFGAGVAASDITFARSGYDLVLGINDTSDQLRIQNWGYGDAYRIERVEFADGTFWDAEYLHDQISAVPIVGTSGVDYLRGWSGLNNILQGLGENDTLYGDVGNETYTFNLGDGQDTIYENDSTPGNLDIIRFGEGIAASDITFVRSGYDLIMAINGTSDQVKILNWGYGIPFRIERVEFADGITWDAGYIRDQISAMPIVGTGDVDYLRGWFGLNNILQGLGGDDALYGDVGNDTYVFGRGDSQDIISDYDTTLGNVDTIRFTDNVLPSEVEVFREGSDPASLVLSNATTGDRITVQGWFNETDTGYRVERVEFANGTVWDENILEQAPIVGTSSDDFLFGGIWNDVFDARSGSDTLDGGSGGDDVYLFGRGDGQDIISDYDTTAGNVDTIRFKDNVLPSEVEMFREGSDPSNLVLSNATTGDRITVQNWFGGADYRVERVAFADGTVWDEDILVQAPVMGTADNDYLAGGAGDDVYLFGRGFGQDTICDFDYANSGGQDTIRLVADINPANVTLSRDTSNLYLSINGTSDSLAISNWFGGGNFRVERMKFADGTVWDATLMANTPYLGTDGADSLSGANDNETFIGGNGDDTLYGNGGNDVLDGGTGDDAMDGGVGDDTYLFGRGYGQDTITDFDSANGGGQDTIRLAAGINPADVTLSRDASSLYLSINGTSDRLTVSNWYGGTNYRVERVEFAGGIIWDATLLANAPDIDTGLPGTSQQTPQGEIIVGQNSDDTLYGNGGNDVLDGGLGYDTLQGGAGDDAYLFGRGYGRDIITDFDSANGGGQDTIRLAADINPADVTLSRDASSLYLSINGTSDRLTVSNWYGGTNYRVERVEFVDGTGWDATLLAKSQYLGTDGADSLSGTNDNETFIGGSGDDTLYGNGGNDVLDGGLGYDILQGGAGDDIYLFGRGYGRDTISDFDYANGGGQDTIRLAVDINPADVTLSRDASSLYLSINGTSDRLIVSNWYGGTNYRVERMEFVDGTVWDATLLANAPYFGTDGAYYFYGTNDNETLIGGSGDDTLYGNGGNDILNGGMGNDTLDGGTDSDIYVFGQGAGRDTISEYDSTVGTSDTILLNSDVAPGDVTLSRDASNLYLDINGTSDTIIVQNWFADPAYQVEQIKFADGTVWDTAVMQAAKLMGTEDSDYLFGSSGDDVIVGLGGDDYLWGDAGNDTLDGGTGSDTLCGNTGNDTYVFGRDYGQDTISDYDTTVGNSDTILLNSDVVPGDVTLWHDASNLYLGLNGTSDTITVQSWFDDPAYRVERIEFADGTVWDTAVMQAAKLVGTENSDYLAGSAGNDVIQGLGGDDYLSGEAGNDTLDGGTGADTMIGGLGNDIFLVDNDVDLVIENAGEGADRVYASVSYTLGDNIENLYLTGASAIDGTGNSSNNIIEGNSAANILYGLGGDDTINGGEGADTMIGGLGNDIFTVDNVADIVIENTGGGTDLVYATISYTLGDNLENLTLTGVNAINGAGNSSNNAIIGNAAANILYGLAGDDDINGGEGADTMVGGLGNDIFTVDNVADIVIENAGEGIDRVYTTVSYALSDNIEKLTLSGASAIDGTGNSLNNTIVGNAGANVLYGLAGNDDINGGAGADSMIGGLGNDIFTVDNVADLAIEYVGEGIDRVYASVSYALGDNIENLYLTGASAIDGTGNSSNNIIEGNSVDNILYGLAGDDTINGGAGADTMIGGLGNDLFTVDNVADLVIENAGEGTDRVSSTISYTLGDNLENLTLTGANAIDGTGNSLSNIMAGNAAANILCGLAGNDNIDGGAGADTMAGGLGNDIFYVDNSADLVIENAGEGTDRVYSTISYALGANVENLTLSGTAAINGTGNTLANVLTGNSASNTLIGGAGNDTLVGGAGNDTYVFNAGDGSDTINNSDATGFDIVTLGASIGQTSVGLFRNGNNLEIGYSDIDKVSVSNYFANADSMVDEVNLADGSYLSAADINQVIQDMAAYAVNEGIAMNSINDVRHNEQLMNLVIGSWRA